MLTFFKNNYRLTPMIATAMIVCLTTLMNLPTANATVRHYKVDVEQSVWGLDSQSRLRCELTHAVPGFGTAQFAANAAKKLNLAFTMDMLRLPDTYRNADVYSLPPSWMVGAQHKKLGTLALKRQYAPDAGKKTAWRMLTELEKGFWPTIYYTDWLNDNDKVAVSLNASNFKQEYQNFSRCIANLLPYSFEDIAYTVLAYQKDSAKLTAYSKKRLDMIGEYLKEDPELELVLLDAYSDSYGGDWVNEQLSIKRANEIRDFFADKGVDPNRIEVTGHGEKRHIASNATGVERAKNKRVVIRLSRQS